MKRTYDRREDILQFIQPHMDECFKASCRVVQRKLEKYGSVMWNELREIIQEILVRTADMQKRGCKGKIAYLVCSFLQSSVYIRKLMLRIEALDEGFYLDEQEVEGHYFLWLLQDNYQEDLETLHQKVYKKFIRVQEYELEEVNTVYTEYYNVLICEMIQSMGSLIMRTVSESGVFLSESFQLAYGEYMGSADVLYTKERNEDDVFHD